MITEQARAKVNLCLHVTGRRADGFHLLDSLVVFADVGDVLHLSPGPMHLSISGPFSDGLSGDNLVLQAAELTGATASMVLEKHLPVASGIGGGSADAAACLRGLARLGYDMPDRSAQTRLGADVPVCLGGRPARMRGIGDVVEPVANWPQMAAVLVNPGVAVPTPAVFKTLQARENPPLEWPPYDAPLDWLTAQRNDLEGPAQQIAPEIGTALAALRESGGQLARMSGSGATCFGIFDSFATAQAAAQALARPGWWVRATMFGGSYVRIRRRG